MAKAKDFPKSATSVVRVQRTTYRGKEYISARVYFLGEESPTDYLPTKAGLTLSPALAAEVAREMLALVKEGDS